MATPDLSMDHPLMGTLIHWGHTLHEPLLPPRLRNRLDGNFTRAHREHPDRVHVFLAGLIAEAIRTLPEDDPWRHLSGQIDNITVGHHPPDNDGAVSDLDGEPFGSWRDSVDVSGFEAITPWDDTALIAVTDELHPHAAATLAAGAFGWRAVARMIRQAEIVGDRPVIPPGTDPMPFLTDPAYLAAHDLAHARTSATNAVRWAAHRRRSYLGYSDPWLPDAITWWAHAATREPLAPDETTGARITQWRVATPRLPDDPAAESWLPHTTPGR